MVHKDLPSLGIDLPLPRLVHRHLRALRRVDVGLRDPLPDRFAGVGVESDADVLGLDRVTDRDRRVTLPALGFPPSQHLGHPYRAHRAHHCAHRARAHTPTDSLGVPTYFYMARGAHWAHPLWASCLNPEMGMDRARDFDTHGAHGTHLGEDEIHRVGVPEGAQRPFRRPWVHLQVRLNLVSEVFVR